jgi:hypothetical protein
MDELTSHELADTIKMVTRAVILQQVEINALESALASRMIVPYEALVSARLNQMERARPMLDLVESDRKDDFLQAVQTAFANP